MDNEPKDNRRFEIEKKQIHQIKMSFRLLASIKVIMEDEDYMELTGDCRKIIEHATEMRNNKLLN